VPLSSATNGVLAANSKLLNIDETVAHQAAGRHLLRHLILTEYTGKDMATDDG
jgi:CO dehydrogenase/acetyl-CoA synthase alpha subunit